MTRKHGVDELAHSVSQKSELRLLCSNLGWEPPELDLPELSHRFRAAVVVPTHNREKFILECIEVAVRNAPEWCQIVVVDDGSEDNTSLIVASTFPEVTLVHTPYNGGVSAARNLGNVVSDASIIIDLDSDDLLLPDAVELVCDAISEGAHYVYGDAIELDDGCARLVRKPDWEPSLLLSAGCFVTGIKAYRRELWQAIGGFDEGLSCAVDLDFALRAEEMGARFVRVAQPLVIKRSHAEQISAQHRELQGATAHEVIRAALQRRGGLK